MSISRFSTVFIGGLLVAQLAGALYPVHDAAGKGDIQSMDAALQAGADVNGLDQDHATPLLRALMFHHADAARWLVEHGADVNHQDDRGVTPLMRAAAVPGQAADLVRLLLERGADPQQKSQLGQTAVFFGDTLEVFRAFKKAGLDLDLVDLVGKTPLSEEAHAGGNADILELLLKNGADVNGRGTGVPLVRAAMASREENLEILIRHGADVRRQDTIGRTALHYPYTMRMVEILIEKGADLNATDQHGLTPLHQALDSEITRFLLAKGADPSIRNRSRQTPLDTIRFEYQRALRRGSREKATKLEAVIRDLEEAVVDEAASDDTTVE